MANRRPPKKLVLPHYVSTRVTHKQGTEKTQLTFELRDSDNCLVEVPPSATIPVCALHVPQTDLPDELASKVFPDKLPCIEPFITLDSLGILTFTLAAEKGRYVQDYATDVLGGYLYIIRSAMSSYLNIKLPFTDGKSSGHDTQSEMDVICVTEPLYPKEHLQLGLNLGKMFVEKLFATSAPFPEFTRYVHWDFPIDAQSARSTSQREIPRVVSVPSYALKPSFSIGNLAEAGKSGKWTKNGPSFLRKLLESRSFSSAYWKTAPKSMQNVAELSSVLYLTITENRPEIHRHRVVQSCKFNNAGKESAS